MRAGPSRCAGFTLVEVLVALVIVALALGAALRAAGALTVAQERLEQQTYAGWSADNRLIELRLARVFASPGRGAAACPQGKLELVCVTDISNTANPGIRRVDVQVFLASDRDTPLHRRTGFLSAQPGGPGGGQ